MPKPTAVQTMKRQMLRLQQAQSFCVDDYGVVKTYCRERYQILTLEIRSIKEAIDTFERITA